VKLLRTFMSLENGVRKPVTAVFGRGKVDVYVNCELASEAQAVPKLNNELAVAYHKLFVDVPLMRYSKC